ncbi:hypothetical protein [Chitinimonas sp.]|uniref:hypothetical protein n=1 Tax=Chitinimonas sp. TaxID=1934313 RepID=UPI0035AF3072
MSTTAFPVNPELSAIAIGYKNRDVDLIADLVMPRIYKGAKKFAYTKYNQADAYTVPATRVGRKSEPTMVDFGGTLVQAECVDWGLDDIVPNDEVEAWQAMPKPPVGGPVSPLAKSTSLLTGLIQLDREIRVANIVFNPTTYQAGLQSTLSGTSQWSDYANSNPLSALLNALDQPLFRPNTLAIGQAAWTVLRQHPKLVQAIYGTAQNGGSIGRQQLADLLEIKQVVVGAGFVNTARRGQNPTMSRVWGKHASLLYISQDAADADQPTFGFTAQFGERIAGDLPEPKVGLRGGVRVRVGESVLEVIADNSVGFLFQNVA